jgi:tyrosyl-tRNA synthetase
MKLSEELTKRGFINQASAESLALIFDEEKRVVYQGIDPTAESAHAGNFVIWMLLKHLMNDGHKVIFLVGGGTGMIGDPKPDAERVLSTRAEVEGRSNKIKTQAKKILGSDISFVDNYDWLSKVNLIEFLRDIGKHFTINELIKKDAISKRLQSETGLSYTEFAYPLLQAFDYLKLYQDSGCTLQVGGSDQWGNIVSGVDLVRRVEKATVYAVTVPLIVDKATGKKFGKSEGNAVWLDENLTSSYELFQFWFNVSDESVVEYLKLFTFLSLDEISEIEKAHLEAPQKRLAQEALAKEVVSFVHSFDAAQAAKKVTEVLFGKVELKDLSATELELVKQNAPKSQTKNGDSIVELMTATGLAESKREAKTFIESKAVFVNDILIEDIEAVINESKFGQLFIMKRGKKTRVLVEIT